MKDAEAMGSDDQPFVSEASPSRNFLHFVGFPLVDPVQSSMVRCAVTWMCSWRHICLNPTLADEMGLVSKRSLSSLLSATTAIFLDLGPHFVVVLKTTLQNQVRELTNWTTGLQYCYAQGDEGRRIVAFLLAIRNSGCFHEPVQYPDVSTSGDRYAVLALSPVLSTAP